VNKNQHTTLALRYDSLANDFILIFFIDLGILQPPTALPSLTRAIWMLHVVAYGSS